MSQYAEPLVVESFWSFEHAMVPVDYQSGHPYDQDGKLGVQPETHLIDPLIALTAVAANIRTLRLGTGINIVSQAIHCYWPAGWQDDQSGTGRKIGLVNNVYADAEAVYNAAL